MVSNATPKDRTVNSPSEFSLPTRLRPDPTIWIANAANEGGIAPNFVHSSDSTWSMYSNGFLEAEKAINMQQLIEQTLDQQHEFSGKRRLLSSSLEKYFREKRNAVLVDELQLMQFASTQAFADDYDHSTYVAVGARTSKNTVFISTLLKRGSLAVAVTCVFSLLMVFLIEVPIIHPFVAVLTVVACPFFYMMGANIERSNKTAGEGTGIT